MLVLLLLFCFQAEYGIRDLVRSRGLGDVYKRQAGLGTAFLPGFCDPLFGGKVGIEKSLKGNWVFAPAVGYAFNTDESDRSSLFVDAEINKRFGNRAYIGTGLGLWDITHSDFITPTAILHFGLCLLSTCDAADERSRVDLGGRRIIKKIHITMRN